MTLSITKQQTALVVVFSETQITKCAHVETWYRGSRNAKDTLVADEFSCSKLSSHLAESRALLPGIAIGRLEIQRTFLLALIPVVAEQGVPKSAIHPF